MHDMHTQLSILLQINVMAFIPILDSKIGKQV